MDFLVHLRRDKGLSVLAVKGYRSALNSVFALKGMDLADSRPISMLIRSFSKSVRPEELCPPAWNVALVLQSLTCAPYEPLRTSDELFLAILRAANSKFCNPVGIFEEKLAYSIFYKFNIFLIWIHCMPLNLSVQISVTFT